MTSLRIIACALLLAAPAAAQAAPQTAPGPAARLEDLAFLAGCWAGIERAVTPEECGQTVSEEWTWKRKP